MTYPFASTWAPWHDAVFLLAVAVVAITVVALVRLRREARRRDRSRWDAWLDRLWAEANDLYRQDPLGSAKRWDGSERR